MKLFLYVVCSLVFITGCHSSTNKKDAEQAIRKQSSAFEEAFNEHDSEKLANFWIKDAKYVDTESGETLIGREKIEEMYSALFEQDEDLEIAIDISKITFPKKNQAIETGTAVIYRSNGEEERTAYRAFYNQEGGKWLLSEVREIDFDYPITKFDEMEKLEWLLGSWIDQDEDTVIETNYKWDKYKNFLIGSFSVTSEGQLTLEGRQFITWDPTTKEIRSWLFDSEGSFGEGKWKQMGNSWVVETSQILGDGRRASSINVYTPINSNSYSWESTGREVEGEILPNIGPITVEKQK